jgi:hypothetical protein
LQAAQHNCDQTETIEHLIYGCEEYSADLWTELGQSLTHVITAHIGKAIPTIQFTPLEIVYNKIHPSVKLHIKEKSIQSILAHLTEEIKRDIIFRRMNTNANQRKKPHQNSLPPPIYHQKNDITTRIPRNKKSPGEPKLPNPLGNIH